MTETLISPAAQKQELFAEWLNALRSGEYQKTRGVLHNKNGYCCLGVLDEAVFGATWSEDVDTISFGYFDNEGNTGMLDFSKLEPLGLDEPIVKREAQYLINRFGFGQTDLYDITDTPFSRAGALAAINDRDNTTFEDVASTIEDLGWYK